MTLEMKIEEREEIARKEGREEGIKGAINLLKELNVPTQEILKKIIDKYNLSEELAQEYIDKC